MLHLEDASDGPLDLVIVKLGTIAPEGSIWHDGLLELRQQWRELSDGKVELRIYAGNQASRRVAEKLGFELEAVLHRNDRDLLGRLQDTCVYVKLAESDD